MSQFRATNSAFSRRELVTKLIQNPTATSSPTAILQIRSHGITDGTSNVPGAPQDPSISEIRPLRRSEKHKLIFGKGHLMEILAPPPLLPISELPQAPNDSPRSLNSSSGPTSSRPEQASDLRSADPCHDESSAAVPSGSTRGQASSRDSPRVLRGGHFNLGLSTSPMDTSERRRSRPTLSSPLDSISPVTSRRIIDPPADEFSGMVQRNPFSKNFVTGLSAETKILDVPSESMGTLCGAAPSISFIPDNMLSSVRQIFIHAMRRIESATSASNPAIESLAWKKYFLLPTILFDNTSRERKIKDNMRARIQLLVQDDWSQFTLGSLQLKPMNQRLEFRDDEITKRITKLVSVGQISKGYKVLTGNQNRIAQDEWAYNLLKDKFPETGENNLTDEQRAALRAFNPGRVPFPGPDFVRKIVMKQGNMISHGYDHFRNEHLKKIYGWSEDDPTQIELRRLHGNIIERIMNGDVPDDIRPLYTDTEAFAGPKSDTDIRPLGKVNLDRKIAGATLLKMYRPLIMGIFGDVQYAIDPKGTEKIVHSIRTGMEAHPEYDFFAPDAANAFNRCNREIGLFETMTNLPFMFPFTKFLYGSESSTWFHGMNDGIQNIRCQEGSQQGCNLGNFLCGMAFLPFIRSLSSVIREKNEEAAFTKFFVDDGNVFCPFETMCNAIEHMTSQGRCYGYNMNMGKSVYLMGRCGSFQAAQDRKNLLISYGLSPENIHIHPSDYELSSLDDSFQSVFREKYGAKVLGSFIGSPEFIAQQLDLKLQSLEQEAEKVLMCKDLQQRYIFSRYCFGQKINHILRTTDLRLTEDFGRKFDIIKKKLLCSLIGQFNSDSIPESTWIQSSLPTSTGGLGLDDSSRIRFAAFLGSVVDCLQTTNTIVPGWIAGHLRTASNVREAIDFIKETSTTGHEEVSLSLQDVLEMGKQKEDSDAFDHKIGRQYDLTTMMNKAVFKRLKDSVSDKHLGWITSISHSTSSRFLNVIPKGPSFTFESNEFRILLNMRLYLNQPDRSEGLRCDCKSRPIIDDRTHHLITGCPKLALGMNIHNSVCNTIKELANSAGIRAKREQVGAFQNVFVPGFTAKQRNMRPDLSLFDLPFEPRNVILDISSTAPIPIFGNAPFTRVMARQSMRAADARYQQKMDTYDAIATANNLKFHPIIFETTGSMHPESQKFIMKLLEVFNHHYQGGALLKKYWLDRISCSYQHQVAKAIRDKLSYLKGQRYCQGVFENRPNYINEYGSICLPISN